MADAFGSTPEEMIGKTDADFNNSEEQLQKFKSDDDEVLASGTGKFIPEELFTDRKGQHHWMQVTKIPIGIRRTTRPDPGRRYGHIVAAARLD